MDVEDFSNFAEQELRAYVVGTGRVLLLRLLKTGKDREQKIILDELSSLVQALKDRVAERLNSKRGLPRAANMSYFLANGSKAGEQPNEEIEPEYIIKEEEVTND